MICRSGSTLVAQLPGVEDVSSRRASRDRRFEPTKLKVLSMSNENPWKKPLLRPSSGS